MKIYVGGKYADRAVIRSHLMEPLVAKGHQITHDWTAPQHNAEGRDLGQVAVLDLNGVVAADLVIFLLTDHAYEYRGCCTELGIALATNKSIVIIGSLENAVARNVFYHHPAINHISNDATGETVFEQLAAFLV